jgi:hypothetical protein
MEPAPLRAAEQGTRKKTRTGPGKAPPQEVHYTVQISMERRREVMPSLAGMNSCAK